MFAYPERIQFVLKRLREAGHVGYVVGGALRNLMLGREVNDWDVTTAATPEKLQEIFADCRYYDAGLKHGTLALILGGEVVEVTTFRVDGEYRDSRHPESVRFTDRIAEDLCRRDFTVNAMAYNDEVGLVDLYGGREDLEARIIRAVGEPERRFSEDALRILRGFRFASALGFSIEEKTLAAMRTCRRGLDVISAERIATELSGILVGEDAGRVVALMENSGVLERILPGARRGSGLAKLPRDFTLRMAYLLRAMTPEEAGQRARSLKLSNADASRVVRLVRSSALDVSTLDEKGIRRLMAEYDSLTDAVLDLQDARGRDTARVRQIVAEARERGDCLTIGDLAVRGNDLAALGLRGTEIGKALSMLLERVMNDPTLNEREKLLEVVKMMH